MINIFATLFFVAAVKFGFLGVFDSKYSRTQQICDESARERTA